MKALGIDTVGEIKSIALAGDGELIAEVSFQGDLSTEFWPRLEELLSKSGVGVEEIGCLAVNSGPGSWTGLRFGFAVVKGLAAARGGKVFVLPAAELAAAEIPGRTPAAVLASRCRGGVDPADAAPIYGSLPKFKMIKEGKGQAKL